MKYKGKTALITGASSGIGAAFARELARRGTNLVLVARSKDKLERLASELRQKYNVAALVIAADLTLENEARRVFETTQTQNAAVDFLINNAGVSFRGNFDELSFEKNHSQIMLNVAALTDLTHYFLPPMLRRGEEGAIINVGSTTGFYPLPFQAVYAATKAFVLSFSEALWIENRKRGIRVLALCPGATDTAIFDRMGGTPNLPKHAPEKVVAVALKALERNKHFVIPGFQNNIESRLLPRLLPRSAMARFVGRVSRMVFKDNREKAVVAKSHSVTSE